MLLGLMEIGSRATRFLIADVEGDGKFVVRSTSSKPIGLAVALALGRQGVARAMVEIERQGSLFAQEAKSKGAERVLCFGTAAVRRIRDQNLFDLAQFRPSVYVLDANMEADCAFWGAVKDPGLGAKSGDTFFVIDLGGGSVEIVSGVLKGNVPTVIGKKSIAMGAICLIGLVKQGGFDAKALTIEIKNLVKSMELPKPEVGSKVILLGGVATKTAWQKVRRNKTHIYNRREMSLVSLSVNELDDRSSKLIALARNEPLEAMKCVDPRSGNLDELMSVITGSIFYSSLLKRFRKKVCLVSPQGISYGLAHMAAHALV